MTSGIQLQEAPPKDAEPEPGIRPKRRLCICRGLCGLDGTRPCWCCSPVCFVITLVVLWLLFLIIMFIGQAVEQAEVDKAPDTDWVYDTLEVCSASNRTYATLDAARSSWVEVVLTQGLNRQVRRLTASAGFPTVRLVRVGIGALELPSLKLQPGEWCAIEPESVLGVADSRSLATS